MKILILLIEICLSFILGIVIYKNISHVKYKKYLDVLLNVNLIKIIILFLFIYMCLTYIIPYIYDSLLSYITVEAASNTFNPSLPSENSPSSPSTSSSSNSGGDAIIMTAALASGAKIAQKAPNFATKAAVVAGSVALGASAIVVKNVSGNLSSDIGKSSLVLLAITNISCYAKKESSHLQGLQSKEYSTLMEYLYKIFDLSGNSVLDLLKIIDYLNNLQYLFLYIIIYVSIILSINTSIVELVLNKILPKKFVQYFMKSVNLVKKSGRIYILILFLLLSYNIYLSNHCFSILYGNFDTICELHLASCKARLE